MSYKELVQKLLRQKKDEVGIKQEGDSNVAGFEAALREVVAPAELPRVSADFESTLMGELDLTPQLEPKAGLLPRLGWILPVIVSLLTGIYFLQDVHWLIYRSAMRFTALLAGSVIRLEALFGKMTVYAAGESSRRLDGLFNGSLSAGGTNAYLLLNITLVAAAILSAVVAVRMIDDR
jgi:hypothetical protein